MTAPTIVSGVNSDFNTGNTTTVNVLLAPSSFANGDSIYIAMASDLISQTFSCPRFTALLSSPLDIPATSPTATFSLLRQANVVKANETFDGTNYKFVVTVGTTERQAWFVWAVHGDGGIGHVGTNTSGNSATATIPAITTTVNNSLVIGIVATDGVSTPHGAATGYTKMGEVSGASAASVSVFYQDDVVAGTIASQNVTITSEQWLGVVFEILGIVGTAQPLKQPARMDGLGNFYRTLG